MAKEVFGKFNINQEVGNIYVLVGKEKKVKREDPHRGGSYICFVGLAYSCCLFLYVYGLKSDYNYQIIFDQKGG